jgi:transcriptional regulator with XRE-family HTH domain
MGKPSVTGRQIRAARVLAGSKGMTLAELAAATGLSSATLQAIETTPEEAPAYANKAQADARAESLERITDVLRAAGVSFLADDHRAGPGLRYRGK